MAKSTFSWTDMKSKLNLSGGEYPFTTNHYVVSFGSIVIGFSKISGISLKTTEYTTMNEGGNDTPYILLDQNKNFNTITFEKGFGTGFQGSNATDMLELIKEVKIRDMLLVIYDSNKERKKAYYTNTAYVKDIVLSDLNAMGQEVLIQSMTIVYDVFKESKDSSNGSGQKNVSAPSSVGTNSSQKVFSNNVGLQKTKENTEITKANEQNSSINQKEKNALEAEQEKQKLEKKQKEKACF